jgi:ribosomal protein L14
MLQYGSIINIYDNSGVQKVKLLTLKKKNTCYKKVGFGLGSICTSIPINIADNSKIQSEQRLPIWLVITKQQRYRNNGFYLNFSDNCAITIDTRRRKSYGNRIYIPLLKEFRRERELKLIVQKSRGLC